MSRTAVYRFYDSDDRLLYVGITANTTVRWGWHKAKAAWWVEQQRVEVAWFDDRNEAATEELKAIRTEGPIWNRAYTKAAGRAPYSPPTAEVAAEIAHVVDCYAAWRQAEADYRAAVIAATQPVGPTPVAYMASRLGIERKTVYRHLGRSMS